MCARCAARETRDAQTQTNADLLSNSLPPFDPSAPERGLFAEKKDAKSEQNFRSIPDTREFGAIEVPRKQKVRAHEPVIRDNSNALQRSAQSISVATKHYRSAIRDARDTQIPLDIQHVSNMRVILEQDIFEAKSLLRRVNGLSSEYLALELALGEAESARIDEKVDFMAEKTQIAHEAMAFARENEHPSASRFPQRRQADKLDEIELFVEKRPRLNEWCVQNDDHHELNSQIRMDLIVPPPPEFEDPLPVPIVVEQVTTPKVETRTEAAAARDEDRQSDL